MIIIDTDRHQGRLGNHIFQHVAATLLAKKYKMEIVNYHVDFPVKINEDISEKTYDQWQDVGDHNFMQFLNSPNMVETNLKLGGYFQIGDFIRNYKTEILSCIDLPDETIDGTVIHYRIGDLCNYNGGKYIINVEYFEKCLSMINCSGKRYITTDSPNDDRVKYLCNKYQLELLDMSPRDTIIFASKFTNKILSHGTFSWWIGFLGNQSNVYYLDPKEYTKWLGDIYHVDHWKIIT